MTTTHLADGTKIFCLKKAEAQVLDSHVDGYLQHGISLHDGDVLVDVGANIGIFGLRACQKYKNIRVLAFEPIPAIYKVLQANAQAWGAGRYQTFNCGLSDEPGRLTFTYFPNSPALSTAHPEDWEQNPNEFSEAVKGSLRTAPMWYARLVPRFLSKWIAKILTSKSQKVDCPLYTLSQILAQEKIERVDLLKIDCEGAELKVLQGIAEVDWPKIQKAVIEVHNVDNRLQMVEDLLRAKGFVQIVKEQEAGFEATSMVNIFATR